MRRRDDSFDLEYLSADRNHVDRTDGTIWLIVFELLIRKQHVGEAEIAKIFDPHGVENAYQMIAFMLHYAGMKALDRAIDRLSSLSHSGVAKLRVSRHQSAHAGH